MTMTNAQSLSYFNAEHSSTNISVGRATEELIVRLWKIAGSIIEVCKFLIGANILLVINV